MWRIVSTTSLKLTQRYFRVVSQNNQVRRTSSSLLCLPWKSSGCGPNGRSFEEGNHHRQLTFLERRDNRRLLSLTSRNKEHHQRRENSKQIEINRHIVSIGKKKNWTGILDLYTKERNQFNHINYATSMSQLGRIQSLQKDDIRLEGMMIDIATQIKNSREGSWDAQGLANVLHAVAKLKLESTGSRLLIDSILGEANLNIIVKNGKPQAIANTAWACATLGVECPSLFEAIDNNALYLIENGNSQEIANTAWAFAKLGVECPSLFEAIDNNALYLIENGNSQEIANTAWACATLGVECPSLFEAINNNALYLIENGNSQEIANTAWACATLGVECPLLFKAIDDNALYLIENGNSQEIANTAWACATLGVECPSLFKAIDNNSLYLVENGKSHDIAQISRACSTLGVECPSLFKAIDNKALYPVESVGKPTTSSSYPGQSKVE